MQGNSTRQKLLGTKPSTQEKIKKELNKSIFYSCLYI
ncbi:uncharacterized protein METZ01_LOCUS118953 [marine metagenome]|uniref:Uncharacterized protein n=1 Tax=marine metagenome TaxID=408172 RepID=A0A381XMY9_9ZZZZ